MLTAMKPKTEIMERPLSLITVNRILVVLAIFLVFLAAYFHAKWQDQVKKSATVETTSITPF